jgi:protein-disulfide isomerase
MPVRFLLVVTTVLLLGAGRIPAQTDPLLARTKGSPRAPVTVYEMSDFQCPFCKRHADQTFPTLEREYNATGKVRWIFINFPLSMHRNAPPAAELAMCAARVGKFWPAHDLLYRHQKDWEELPNPGNYFLGLADSLKLPRDRIRACLESGATRSEIKDDAAGAMRSGATSTPSFYIEGGMLAGALPVEVWRPILDSVYKAKTGK